jgi:protoporphyrinogen oxidase
VIAILGSGMAGCGAAHRLRAEGLSPVLFEKKHHPGGHTASYEYDNGWVFDEGPHISFTRDQRLQALLADNVDHRYERLQTKVNNYWRGHWIKHPAQCNLYGLPEDLVVACIRDFVDAQHLEDGPVETYADWLTRSFGETFARTFPMEYTVRYHTTTADNLTTDWIGPRLYRASFEEVLRGALSPRTADVHYIDQFRYPTEGGFVAYLRRFFGAMDVRTDHEVTAIDAKARRLRFRSGLEVDYGQVISSIPLPELVPLVQGVPEDILEASRALACTTAVIVNLGIAKPEIIDAHWTYFYDRDFFLTRLSTPHLQSRHNVPDGCCSVQAECYFSRKYRPLDRAPQECIQPVVDDLTRCGLLTPEDRILFADAMLVPYANVIFDRDRAAALATVHGYLQDVEIAYCGRYGDWGYMWTDESFISGERAAETVLARC